MSVPPGIVFIVDDDASVRRAAARLLRSTGFQVETFANSEEFLASPRPDLPSCLLLDVRMPGLSGVELQEKLDGTDLPIIFMSGHGDIPMTVRAIKAGAIDFLPKPVAQDRLLQCVTDAIHHHTELQNRQADERAFRARMDSLTNRETEVLRLVIKGLLNKQIAKQLGITEATVKVHRGHVMEKSGVRSVAELVRLCERADIR